MSHLSYKKLWKRLIDLDLTKTQLREGAGISTSTMSRLKVGSNVNTEVIVKICDYLSCRVEDICELEKSE
ncbi:MULTISPECIES: helix-turn-helix domain-containing protein [Jonquetella]|uniref:Putative transcriptional regulator n=1 Tax=Jonquetella anthropi DSM 22815 TaxID=885272 RepID=H0UKA5_9BACT|nr:MULTISPECIES: helix-turn-helix transcriptional regulator [Jonquetella]EHM13114.1 putative transcriptional regulator [Jonquetella anthropi DSM 22815]